MYELIYLFRTVSVFCWECLIFYQDITMKKIPRIHQFWWFHNKLWTHEQIISEVTAYKFSRQFFSNWNLWNVFHVRTFLLIYQLMWLPNFVPLNYNRSLLINFRLNIFQCKSMDDDTSVQCDPLSDQINHFSPVDMWITNRSKINEF